MEKIDLLDPCAESFRLRCDPSNNSIIELYVSFIVFFKY